MRLPSWTRAACCAANRLLLSVIVIVIGALLIVGPGQGAERPPLAMRILWPLDGALIGQAEVTLRIAVQLPEGVAVRHLSVFLGEKEIARTRGVQLVTASADEPLGPGEVLYRLSVTLPAEDCVITVKGETTEGPSEPVPLRLRAARPLAGEFAVSPRLYLLAIGVSAYQQANLRLIYPAKDARDLTAAFSRQKGLLFREVNSRLLVDQEATKAGILDGLEWIQHQTTARDVAVVFLAGHGINDSGTGRYHFLPVDADLAAIKRTMLSQEELQSTLRNTPGKVLFFLDSCHAGNLLGSWATRGDPDLSRFINELASSENGVVVFAAATGSQLSQEAERWGNGAFTKAVVEGLTGRAAFVKGRPITVNMLDLYISERVKELTGGAQTPATAKPSTLPDFPIAAALGTGQLPPAFPSEPPRGPEPNHPPRLARPLYQRWWFWSSIIGGAAVLAVGLGLGLAPRPQEPVIPGGVTVIDPGF